MSVSKTSGKSTSHTEMYIYTNHNLDACTNAAIEPLDAHMETRARSASPSRHQRFPLRRRASSSTPQRNSCQTEISQGFLDIPRRLCSNAQRIYIPSCKQYAYLFVGHSAGRQRRASTFDGSRLTYQDLHLTVIKDSYRNIYDVSILTRMYAFIPPTVRMKFCIRATASSGQSTFKAKEPNGT